MSVMRDGQKEDQISVVDFLHSLLAKTDRRNVLALKYATKATRLCSLVINIFVQYPFKGKTYN